MKLNTLFVAAICAGTLLASCNPKTATDNQLKYTGTSLVDGDAYSFFQIVGAKVPYEVAYATYAESVSSSTQVKQLAAKVKEVYGGFIPQMDSLAITVQVDFPIKGAELFQAPVAVGDSTTTSSSVAFTDEAYILHVQKEAAILQTQFKRTSRNTHRGLRDFAAASKAQVEEIYTLAGGTPAAGGHH